MRNLWFIILGFILPVILISCGQMNTKKDIELMGAGDRIHDTFTFANVGVDIKEKEMNVYEINGSVEKLEDEAIKKEFDIDSDVTHVVAIKLSADGKEIDESKLEIKVDGVRSYDSEHLNGKDYTFIILEAVKGKSVSIAVSWNGVDENNYILTFSEKLILK